MNEKASKPLTGLIRFGYALLCCLPLWLLLPFASAALYSSPSTDDFCLASQNLGQAAAAVHQYYVSVTGRLPALIIITLPSLVASATHLDLFVVYPLFNFLAFLSFIASLIASATLLLRTNNYLLNGLFGLLLGSAILSIVPNISEFVYWVTGEACYLTAAIGASLFVTWTTNVSLNRARISAISFLLAGLLCAFTAMLNEFTGFILLGAAVLSLLFRLMTLGREAQVARYLVFIGIILLSYSVVLLSPSNVIRLGAYHRSGDISASLDNAMIYLADYCYTMGRSRGIESFGILVACFGIATARRLEPKIAGQNILFAVGLLCFGALWAFASYFIGAYSTGEVLALRARNEVVAVEIVLLSACGVIIVQAILGFLLHFQRFNLPQAASMLAFVAAAYGTWHILPIRTAPTYVQVLDEWPQLVVYWRESQARNALLSAPGDRDVVVPRRTASPRTLAGDELKETATQLPNDCIARFYNKSTVVLAH
ncbi:hypothetical protein [Bradyrhizobium sp. 187]|uniref:hypothetical protein n=1 Tax=Bradyrhizobium sp. 187 TaxID=2782655 RepID=UPI001FFF8289|nr:hypothetical protein [Bradyrhizobium sp. 187]UPJ70882.1 hypothetical protein IVB19_24810 [Bradyrhizobium sp. 187]